MRIVAHPDAILDQGGETKVLTRSYLLIGKLPKTPAQNDPDKCGPAELAT